MIDSRALIWKFQEALDGRWGYIYGKTHEMWSDAKQAAYAREYAGDPDRANSVKYGGKWAGHWVTDCSGLFAWAFKQLGGTIAHGSNSIWDKYCSDKGTLKGGDRTDGNPLRPGTAVFTSSGEKHNHIGLYIGNGLVIEAQGAQAGVVTSLISNKKWTHWGELKGVAYEEEENEHMDNATVVLPVGKSGSTVNMRKGPGTNYDIIARVPVGQTVDVVGDLGDWCQIGYKGDVGWMQSNYLEYAGQADETDRDAMTDEQMARIDAALRVIEQANDTISKATVQLMEATETIGGIVGRG